MPERRGAFLMSASYPLACPLRLPTEVAALSPRGQPGADDHGKAAAREPVTVHAVEEIDRQQRQDDERRDADGAGLRRETARQEPNHQAPSEENDRDLA